MLRIPCPFCGPRDHDEFSYEGDATVRYPALDAPRADWVEAVHARANPRGPHREFWRHVHGCRAFLEVERDTLTHEITAARIAHPAMAAATVSGKSAP